MRKNISLFSTSQSTKSVGKEIYKPIGDVFLMALNWSSPSRARDTWEKCQGRPANLTGDNSSSLQGKEKPVKRKATNAGAENFAQKLLCKVTCEMFQLV